MPNPLSPLAQKLLGSYFFLRLKQQVLGLAEDFWKDGPDNLFGFDLPADMFPSLPGLSRKLPLAPSSAPPVHEATKHRAQSAGDPAYWHAEPGEVSEKMWGDGFVTPGGNVISAMLVKPLGLTKEMSVLDLSAGLGGRVRNTVEETGAYITGLEPDPAIAERGMQLSVRAGKSRHAPITYYDPAKLVLSRSYDCIIARETFYRVPDQHAFYALIAKHTKPHAQIAYTDYILDPEYRDHPAIVAWKNNEKLAHPMGLVESAEAWAKVGFSLRVHEDLTAFYKTEVMVGMKRLMGFLASGVRPDKETAAAVLRRLETWKHRMAAMDAGMKFYRFYGTKQ